MRALVITDLDDTLWQWVTTWCAGYRRFAAYLEQAHNVVTADADEAWARFYADGGGVEYPPTPEYLVKYTALSPDDADAAYHAAVRESRVARDAAVMVFPGVHETLSALIAAGVTVVAHTDSPVTAAVHRLHTAGLDGAVHEVYAAPVFEDFGDGMRLLRTADVHVNSWEYKPSTRVLAEIMRRHGADPSTTFYVGDSLRRDMSMARNVGVTGLWARYGTEYADRDEDLKTVYAVQKYKAFPAEGGLTANGDGSGTVALSAFSDVLDIVLR